MQKCHQKLGSSSEIELIGNVASILLYLGAAFFCSCGVAQNGCLCPQISLFSLPCIAIEERSAMKQRAQNIAQIFVTFIYIQSAELELSSQQAGSRLTAEELRIFAIQPVFGGLGEIFILKLKWMLYGSKMPQKTAQSGEVV